jgi:uncharacterized protein (TIGR03083 family)
VAHTGEIETIRAAVSTAAEDMAVLVEQINDPQVRPRGSEWSVTDIAAHVTAGAELYIGYIRGDVAPALDVSRIAEGSLASTSAAFLAAEPERDPRALASRLRVATTGLLEATEELRIDDRVLWHGQDVTVGALFGLTLGELVLHGADIASALGRRWTIDRRVAAMILSQALSRIDLLVDPVATAGVHQTFDLRIRGAARFTLDVNDGTIRARPPSSGEHVDCHLNAEPVALLLITYGRTTLWRQLRFGRLLAWGRKPWLGLRLPGYLVTP